MKYLRGVAATAKRHGVRIYNGTHAHTIEGGSPGRVETAHGTITAAAIVVATNTPVNDRVAIHTKQGAYRSFVVSGRSARLRTHDPALGHP